MNAHVQPGPMPLPRAEPATLAAMAAARVAAHPAQALIRSGTAALTYAGLWSGAQQVAGGLATSGITAGRIIGVALPQGAERLTAELAVLLLGAGIASSDDAADEAEAVAALTPLAPELIIIPQGSPLASRECPLIDLPTLTLRDDRLPRRAPEDPEALALVRPAPQTQAPPLRLSHSAWLDRLQTAAARLPRDAANSFATAEAQQTREGRDPAWLALIAGATWRSGDATKAAPPRPVLWRSLLQRIGRG